LGIIISLLSFVAIPAKVPIAVLAERVGRWPIMVAVAIGQTVSLLLYSIVPNLTWLYPTIIFEALIMAAFGPTALSLMIFEILELTPPSKRGDTMGKLLISSGAAAMIGPSLLALLINYVDYVQLFRLVAIIPLLGLAPFILNPSQKGSRYFL